MAKTAKKDPALTPEEKLAQALVPESEQPYPIPENWCWIKLNTVIELISGRDAALSDCNSEGIGIPYILGASNLEGNYFSIERWIEVPQVVSKKGDILLSVKGTIGKLYIQQEESINISRQIMAIRPCQEMQKEYVYLFLLSVCEELRNAGNGLIPGISRSDILYKTFPLAPSYEQQRIVDRIESLFAKLDEAKEKAQAVVDGFEDRKAAILHKAFTGELTKKWRFDYKVEVDSWCDMTVGECCELITKGASPKWQGVDYTDDKSQTLFVTSENVREGFLDWSKEKYLDNSINDIQKRSILHKGDVLVNIVGASIGRSAIFDRDCLANTNQAVCIVRVGPMLYNKYLCYYLNSPYALMYYDDNKVETARANISLTNISDMSINLPTCQEQYEIVRQLDTIVERETTIKSKLEQVIEQIDGMKKSILARAFRGELGTNDPADESAEVLLKRIL